MNEHDETLSPKCQQDPASQAPEVVAEKDDLSDDLLEDVAGGWSRQPREE